MFDVIIGLPVHPLIIHAVVVLGPLAALCLVAYAAVPRWRVGLRWPTLLLSAIAAGSAFVATESGEQLEHRVGEPGFDHAERGDLAAISLYVLFGVAVVVILIVARVARQVGSQPAPARGTVPAVVLTVLAAGFAIVAIMLAGHTGAKNVWEEDVANTSTSTGG
ncbi:MAG: DUF2231 domain-containing protein [Tetrasphaera sp.]